MFIGVEKWIGMVQSRVYSPTVHSVRQLFSVHTNGTKFDDIRKRSVSHLLDHLMNIKEKYLKASTVVSTNLKKQYWIYTENFLRNTIFWMYITFLLQSVIVCNLKTRESGPTNFQGRNLTHLTSLLQPIWINQFFYLTEVELSWFQIISKWLTTEDNMS